MNGIHDVGGMHGFGAVVREDPEPVFHEAWEGRVQGCLRATVGWAFNLDEFRHAIERMPPADYPRVTYYEKWLHAITTLLAEKGIVTPEELAGGRPAPGSARLPEPRLTPDLVEQRFRVGAPVRRPEPGDPPRFAIGDAVRVINRHPAGHTRVPRYVRGRVGTVERVFGRYPYPDDHAHGRGESPLPVYGVRFAARSIWGPSAGERDSINLDLWQDYLEPAAPAGAPA